MNVKSHYGMFIIKFLFLTINKINRNETVKINTDRYLHPVHVRNSFAA